LRDSGKRRFSSTPDSSPYRHRLTSADFHRAGLDRCGATTRGQVIVRNLTSFVLKPVAPHADRGSQPMKFVVFTIREQMAILNVMAA
jgi:hypothetical protein